MPPWCQVEHTSRPETAFGRAGLRPRSGARTRGIRPRERLAHARHRACPTIRVASASGGSRRTSSGGPASGATGAQRCGVRSAGVTGATAHAVRAAAARHHRITGSPIGRPSPVPFVFPRARGRSRNRQARSLVESGPGLPWNSFGRCPAEFHDIGSPGGRRMCRSTARCPGSSAARWGSHVPARTARVPLEADPHAVVVVSVAHRGGVVPTAAPSPLPPPRRPVRLSRALPPLVAGAPPAAMGATAPTAALPRTGMRFPSRRSGRGSRNSPAAVSARPVEKRARGTGSANRCIPPGIPRPPPENPRQPLPPPRPSTPGKYRADRAFTSGSTRETPANRSDNSCPGHRERALTFRQSPLPRSPVTCSDAGPPR